MQIRISCEMVMRHPIDTRLKTWRKANVRRSWRSDCLHRHPSYNQLYAKLLSRVNESEEDDNLDYDLIDDDVFENEESCKTTVVDRRSDSCVIYRRFFSLISLRKIWNFLVCYIWTSHSNQSGAQTDTSPGKVVEIDDVSTPGNDWNILDSDSDSEELFQDCEQDKPNDMEDVNFCFSPPAPGFVEAMNRPFSSLFLRHDVIFTPQPATPLVFTPAMIATGSSTQSNTSNRSRLADLCWDNYEWATDDGNVIGRERWSVLPRSQRMPMVSCLKMLWNLDSPSYDQLSGSPITEDVEEDDLETNCQPAECTPQDSVPVSEWLPNNQQDKSSMVTEILILDLT